jgi:2-oxoglutarate-Fe(II)-dependent oxygenase superfamily protein
MAFIGDTRDDAARQAIQALSAHRRYFDDERACFFGITIDPRDESEERLREDLPGIRIFWDFDRRVSKLYGAASIDSSPGAAISYRRFWLVLDPTLRVLERFRFDQHAALFAYLEKLPPPARFNGVEVQAPVLILHSVFEPELCRDLIRAYETHGGDESGFMREMDGQTVLQHNPDFKIRRDYVITDQDLVKRIQGRINRRIVPEIFKIHQFKATRMERYIVACYAAEEGGHFRPHRDNTTPGTAHRRFAISINLNDDFEGGYLSFPEYGPRGYKLSLGGAVVFSCSLLHRVTRVTAGRRYAFLPFLYDEDAARVRERNAPKTQIGTDYKAS